MCATFAKEALAAITKLCTYLLLGLLAIFLMGPFLFLVSTSLEGGDLFRLEHLSDLLPNEPTVQAYKDVFREVPELPRFFLNTAIICFFGVGLELVLASTAAYPLARMEFRGKGLLFGLLLATMMLPAQANIIVNFMTIRSLGLYDTLTAVFLPSSVSVFGIFLMRQAFLVVPQELEDAARIDGCNEFTIFTRVMLPLTRPAMGTLALFGFVAHWNSFMWPLVILKSRELYPLSVGLNHLANTFGSQFRLVAAGSVLAMLPIVILFLLLQKQFISGITAGAIK
ncbi:MAG: carbohydrate ABC transporter permease [Candidatus Eremiobacteraeota bacterium]|nr:carbohydrate ABC transporter permease [Candidatus Eremiobacteraeota bacterium]